MNYLAKNITDVATSYINTWSKDSLETNLLSNKEILKIASILNNSYIDTNLVDLPKLVVVGTQSSGKSSLLNALIGLDILPVGKSMTTRTPLHLELIPSTNDSRVEFGSFQNYRWVTDKKINITYPTLTPEQRDSIRNEIELQTMNKAGTALNISNVPIYLKIYANGVPNLSLIDLPGLTSIAITDRGQPKDIKEQIIALVTEYIQQKNTIILGIIAARPDIEADMAMEIIKQNDPKGERTIGVLTKLDLMNEDADISNYLDNNVSNDLKLKYGYYGIKNRSNATQTIQETIAAEKTYFQNHAVYKQDKYKSHLGISNLSMHLSNILIYNIKLCLPTVLGNINRQLEDTQSELATLGSSIPPEKEIQLTMLNNLLSIYVKSFIQAIELRGSTRQTGRLLKDSFANFRTEIESLNPFDALDDNYLIDILKCYDGIHMSFPYLPIEVLENCLKDTTHRPIFQLFEPSQQCLQRSIDILNNLNQDILEHQPIKKYPHLIKAIRNLVVNEILMPRFQKTLTQIQEIIESEEAYIWTDNKLFNDMMVGEFSKIILANGQFDLGKFKKILYEYYKTVILQVRQSIPKAIVYHLIKSSTDNISSIVYDKILGGDISNLLEEFPEIEQRRKILEKNKKDLLEIKKLIEVIL